MFVTSSLRLEAFVCMLYKLNIYGLFIQDSCSFIAILNSS